MKRTFGVLLLLFASIPVAFFMYAWLDINGIEITVSLVSIEWFFLMAQVGSFFLGCTLLVAER
jgi:hypothetical protein